jgi:multiple sugar transport system substrate-binding protein
MKYQKSYLLFTAVLIGALMLGACAPKAASTAAPANANEPVTLEYWVFADYGSGAAGDLQKTFISEFEAANPGVKINMSPKNDDELTAGITAAAASKTLPDIYMQSDDMGAQDVQLGALENVYDRWMAEPEAFRKQFNPVMVADLTPADKTMYGMPYTGYSSFLRSGFPWRCYPVQSRRIAGSFLIIVSYVMVFAFMHHCRSCSDGIPG